MKTSSKLEIIDNFTNNETSNFEQVNIISANGTT